MTDNNRPVETIPVGFVYFDGKTSYVLSREQARKHEEFVPKNAKHTATVALDVVLERILNNEDGVKSQLKEMRTI
jgi:hypothetical protein